MECRRQLLRRRGHFTSVGVAGLGCSPSMGIPGRYEDTYLQLTLGRALDRPYLIIAAGGSAASLFKRQTQLDHIPLFYYCLVGLQLQSAPSNLPTPRRLSAGL